MSCPHKLSFHLAGIKGRSLLASPTGVEPLHTCCYVRRNIGSGCIVLIQHNL